MRSIKKRFTVIELVTASTLMLIMFMIIGFVFGSVSDCTTKLNDKITEGLKANRFFSQLADDFGSSFPVFYLGEGSDGPYVNIVSPGNTDPFASLPGAYVTAPINGASITTGLTHREFLRCVATNHTNGGLLLYNGSESMAVSMNVDQHDKPVRYISYNFCGTSDLGPLAGGLHERMVYRKDFPLRPDLRKQDNTVRGGYSAGGFVKVGKPGDGNAISSIPADGDINEFVLLEGVWEIRVSFLETAQNSLIGGFGEKVLMKVTVEFAFTDTSFPYGNPARYSRHSMADLDGNFIPDYLEHTYTTVIVVNRNNWEKP